MSGRSPSAVAERRRALRADCAQCFGLCCVALAFTASADFAADKAAGEPCTHLGPDFRCGIHAGLRTRGFKGCTVFDCLGAGQKVSRVTFAGVSWRREPAVAQRMFAVFSVMRQLHELLWYLNEALGLPGARPVRDDLAEAIAETERLTLGSPEALAALDVAAHRSRVGGVLARVSDLVRAQAPRPRQARRGGRRIHRGADLLGARLAGQDLRGADLRGAYLIGADLRGADLGFADLIGADLRDAELGGADVSTSLFLTQAQLDAAHGDSATRLPPALDRPAHWSSSAG